MDYAALRTIAAFPINSERLDAIVYTGSMLPSNEFFFYQTSSIRRKWRLLRNTLKCLQNVIICFFLTIDYKCERQFGLNNVQQQRKMCSSKNGLLILNNNCERLDVFEKGQIAPQDAFMVKIVDV